MTTTRISTMSDLTSTTRIGFGKHRGAALTDLPTGYASWLLGLIGQTGPAAGFAARHEDELRAHVTGGAAAAATALLDGLTLNEGQRAAVDAVKYELLNGASAAMRLEGGAGYGKSFTVAAIVEAAVSLGYDVRATATSYVATQVLAKQLHGFEVRTMASMLRLAKVELEDAESYVVSDKTTDQLAAILGHKQLLIVDEYSMVNDELGEHLLDALEAGGKLLAVGDLKQLPPVKQAHDSVLAAIPASVTLTEPMRYSAQSDLYALEQAVRSTGAVNLSDWSDCADVYLHSGFKGLLSAFIEDSKAHPNDDHRMLFFRRADVLNANGHIRTGMFGAKVAAEQPVVEDERLMVMSTSDLPTEEPTRVAEAAEAGRAPTRRFYSGESFHVDSVVNGKARGIPCHLVTFAGDPTVYPVVFAAGASHTMDGMRGSAEFTEELARLRTEALETNQWGEWRAFKNAFLTVGYNYAMTVHRCQGQTVDRVYFAPGALAAGALTQKLTYVAATRASKEVHLGA